MTKYHDASGLIDSDIWYCTKPKTALMITPDADTDLSLISKRFHNYVMGKWNFTRSEFKMGLRRISLIAIGPCFQQFIQIDTNRSTASRK